MDLNYIILAHNNPNHLYRLVSKLNDVGVYFYIHIDKKNEDSVFKSKLKTFKNVHFIENRVNVRWGTYSIVEATINCLNKVVDDKKNGYCILLSGVDYPIKSNKLIQEHFKNNNGNEFIEICNDSDWSQKQIELRLNRWAIPPSKYPKQLWVIPHVFSNDFRKKYRWSLKKIYQLLIEQKQLNVFKVLLNRKYPKYVKPYGGSQWWGLSIDTVKLILNFIKQNPSFIKYHKNAMVPDEYFFHTIVGNLIHHDKIKNKLTYTKFLPNLNSPEIQKTDEDFNEFADSEFFFARKFDENSSILDKIDNELLNSQ